MNTPSPWVRGEEHETKVDIWSPAAKRIVAIVQREMFSALLPAAYEDADLISAAPELLAALERLMGEREMHGNPMCSSRCKDGDCRYCQARAALKKAKGL